MRKLPPRTMPPRRVPGGPSLSGSSQAGVGQRARLLNPPSRSRIRFGVRCYHAVYRGVSKACRLGAPAVGSQQARSPWSVLSEASGTAAPPSGSSTLVESGESGRALSSSSSSAALCYRCSPGIGDRSVGDAPVSPQEPARKRCAATHKGERCDQNRDVSTSAVR